MLLEVNKIICLVGQVTASETKIETQFWQKVQKLDF